MAIIPLDDFQFSPRDELISEIMNVINIAITSDEHHPVVSIAEQVVKLVEHSEFHTGRPTTPVTEFWTNDADDLGE